MVSVQGQIHDDVPDFEKSPYVNAYESKLGQDIILIELKNYHNLAWDEYTWRHIRLRFSQFDFVHVSKTHSILRLLSVFVKSDWVCYVWCYF